jgi:hypothetical protein
MPLLSWKAFHAAHARRYIVFADLRAPLRRQQRFELMSSLIYGMNPKGVFALLPEENFIRIVFERDTDVAAFTGAVQARKTAREGGWAGQWRFDFDAELETTIKAALPGKKPQGRSGQGGDWCGPALQIDRVSPGGWDDEYRSSSSGEERRRSACERRRPNRPRSRWKASARSIHPAWPCTNPLAY